MRARVLCTCFVLLSIAPTSSLLTAQDVPFRVASLDSIAALGLDSVTGAATAYFRPADRERALELHALLEEFLGFYRQAADIETTLRVAVLDSADWGRMTSLPYGQPNNSGPRGNLLLAATQPPTRVGVRDYPGGRLGDLLVIGHEGGHLLIWELMPPAVLDEETAGEEKEDVARLTANLQQVPIWYWELLANFFATAFIEAHHHAEAAAWAEFATRSVGTPAPRFTHLDDWFTRVMQATAADSTPYMASPEGGVNQSWYQGVVTLLAKHLYDHAGVDFLEHARRTASGEHTLDTEQLIQQLETIAPGTVALLDRVGAGWRAPQAPDPGSGSMTGDGRWQAPSFDTDTHPR